MRFHPIILRLSYARTPAPNVSFWVRPAGLRNILRQMYSQKFVVFSCDTVFAGNSYTLLGVIVHHSSDKECAGSIFIPFIFDTLLSTSTAPGRD